MALVVEDRVAETATTTGTGDFTLAGAIVGFRAFSSVCSVNDVVYYMIEAIDGSGVPSGSWETGFGTYSASNTLTRTTVIKSSNSNAAVNFGAGTKRVTISAIDYYLRHEGTSFPSSPPTNLRFIRTDRGIEYYYDGTRWLSTQIHSLSIANQDSVFPVTFGTQMYAHNPWWNEYDVYVLKGKIGTLNTATTATNYFTFQFFKFDSASTAMGGTTTSQNDAQNTVVGHEISINAVAASTTRGFQFSFTETGAVTGGYAWGGINYRLVG